MFLGVIKNLSKDVLIYMIIRNNRLIADEDKRLVFGDIIAVEVWLAPNDSVDNWKEISKEEAEVLENKLKEKESYFAEDEDIA